MSGFEVWLERLTLAEERVAAAIERLAELSRVYAEAAGAEVVRENRESPVMKAIRLLDEMGPGNIAEIARQAGVHKATLYRNQTFQKALAASRQRGVAEPRSAVRWDEM